MSEYQYYEFQAVDRPLDASERAELREVSSRADISATSFVNSYDWGNFKGDPRLLMERYFDLFLYLANWGSRRLSIRLPARLIDVSALERFCLDDEIANVRTVGPHAIVDIWRDEIDDGDWEDGRGRLAGLAPLRSEMMQGDLRAFYLIWLMSVEEGWIADDAKEPLAGIAPLTAPLQALADFFAIDSDLVDVAAAEGTPAPTEAAQDAAEDFIRSLPEDDKVALLARLHDGDPHIGVELRQLRQVFGELHAGQHRVNRLEHALDVVRDVLLRIPQVESVFEPKFGKSFGLGGSNWPDGLTLSVV